MVMRTELNNDQLRSVAPSIFAERPYCDVSDKYEFIPTINVIDRMRAEGFLPVWAGQSRSRIEGKADFTKHLVRFSVPNAIAVDGTFPEILLTNSHDRTSAYKIMAGLFRMICSNGMIVGDFFTGIGTRHTGRGLSDEVIEGSFEVVKEAPTLMGEVSKMQATKLNEIQADAFAESALVLKYGEDQPPIQPSDVLRVRREGDAGSDLWHVFNRTQENLMRGGIRYKKETRDAGGRLTARRRMRTRAVKSIDTDVKLNRALWTLAERMGEMVSA